MHNILPFKCHSDVRHKIGHISQPSPIMLFYIITSLTKLTFLRYNYDFLRLTANLHVLLEVTCISSNLAISPTQCSPQRGVGRTPLFSVPPYVIEGITPFLLIPPPLGRTLLQPIQLLQMIKFCKIDSLHFWYDKVSQTLVHKLKSGLQDQYTAKKYQECIRSDYLPESS